MVEILDAFPAFLEFWQDARHLDLEGQIDAWASRYMAAWPDLLQKQVEDYASQGVDWKEIAAEQVFPHIPEAIPRMAKAHANLCRSLMPTYEAASRAFDYQFPIVFVIHVGIGCGAGWATQFRGKPAVLFGLENLVDSGYLSEEAIQGLVTHELGHIVHDLWRLESGKQDGSGPWWQLYREGFAQHCEISIRGTWHQVLGSHRSDWLDWCRHNRARLAADFLQRADGEAGVREFFGSWFEIHGKSETGYYLGHEIVAELASRASLKQVALLETYEERCRSFLERMARVD